MTSAPPPVVPLPEPVGFRTRYRSEPGTIGHYPWTYADHGRRRVDRPECEYENLHTADQLEAYAAARVAAELSSQAAELEQARFEVARWQGLAKTALDACDISVSLADRKARLAAIRSCAADGDSA